jgi:hypothetical protein
MAHLPIRKHSVHHLLTTALLIPAPDARFFAAVALITLIAMCA